MENDSGTSSYWSGHEIALLNHVEVFQHKPGIMKKAEHLLNALGEGMILELRDCNIPFPPETKKDKVQLARGENNKGFPYLSLDVPQMFSKTEMFTYRTLFWWGHYLGFSLILKGKDLPRYTENLLREKEDSLGQEVYLSVAPNPWEWEQGDENFKSVQQTSGEELRKNIENIDYIKVIRFYPLNDETFPSLNWVEAGISTWRDLSKITED